MKLYARITHSSIAGLVKIACLLSLLALGLICYSVLVPRPLPVILAMSLGHVIGGSAFACYLLAVILDATGRPPPADRGLADGMVDAGVHGDETPELVPTPTERLPSERAG